MLAEDALDHYLKAGQIASEVRRQIKDFVKEGTPIINICETVENNIRKKGGEPAFPCNVCINDIAAHYSSPPLDMKTIPKDAVVKVDLGVQVEGYIADTAITVSLSPQYDAMVYAVNDALEQAINTVQPKVKINEISRIIQKTIDKYGFRPIRNLTGHQMRRYLLHAGKSIPNVPSPYSQSINEGEIYAIEPFLTLASGGGEVRQVNDAYIYRFQKERRVSNSETMDLLTSIKSEFKTLPFSKRWIRGIEDRTTCEAFNELLDRRCISSYPVLIEGTNEIVTQAEHTVVITKDGYLVTTR